MDGLGGGNGHFSTWPCRHIGNGESQVAVCAVSVPQYVWYVCIAVCLFCRCGRCRRANSFQINDGESSVGIRWAVVACEESSIQVGINQRSSPCQFADCRLYILTWSFSRSVVRHVVGFFLLGILQGDYGRCDWVFNTVSVESRDNLDKHLCVMEIMLALVE